MQQTVPELHFDLLDAQQLKDVVNIAVIIRIGRRLLIRFLEPPLRLLLRAGGIRRLLRAPEPYAGENQNRAEQRQNRLWKSRNEHKHQHHDAGNDQNRRILGKLDLYVIVKASRAGGSGYDHTGRDRDQKRGNLGTETVADRRDGVGRKDAVEVAAVHHADHRAADQVDQRGNDRNDRVALYEFRGTVHRAEKSASR